MRNFMRNPIGRWLLTAMLFTTVVSVAAQTDLVRPASAATPKVDAKQTKVNLYVELLNSWWTKRMFDDARSYAKWVSSLETGPTCTERNIRGFGSFDVSGTSKPALDAAVKQLAQKPSLAPDAAALKMIEIVRAFEATITEATAYFKAPQFKADKCARGAALHKTLMTGWRDFRAAETEVRAFVVQYNDALDLKLLADAKKKYGEGFRYYIERQMGDAKLLIRELNSQFDADKPDFAAIQTRHDALAATLAVIDEKIEKVKADKTGPNKKIYDNLYQNGYERTVTASRSLQRAVKALLEAVDANIKSANSSNALQIDNKLKEAFTHYNAMIEQFNKMKLLPSVK